MRYRIALADDPTVAVERTVVVHERVTLGRATAHPRRRMPLRLSGVLSPRRAGARVTVQLLTRRGWVAVAHPRLNSRSVYSALVVPPVAGRYLFRALAPATAVNGSGVSRTLAVQVR